MYLEEYLQLEFWEFHNCYVFSESFIDNDWQLLHKYNNIVFILTENFNYMLKQFSTAGKLNQWDTILTWTVWDYYLGFLDLNVFTIRVQWDKLVLLTLNKQFLEKKYWVSDPESYIDFLVLQEKNDDSIWAWKTLKLLQQYGGITWILKSLEEGTITDQLLEWVLQSQRVKLEFFDFYKQMLVTNSELQWKKH